ncbi:vacuolar protein sorting 28 family protein [Tieghemostelium lacteum]|uniref:Vacuolar protein sorting 28 family protein n=1 Tax=Tieghemostelium lacteum TaxID=361077 RepID=A0A151ZI59_TIELA|nr:vacuolar protein sorting 28 family protein [Tieghemostelium lacteum]|eukprot:KYQ93534.1 vacuolar protein sorting 28 family protein [Tieghemostelium lacteum]
MSFNYYHQVNTKTPTPNSQSYYNQGVVGGSGGYEAPPPYVNKPLGPPGTIKSTGSNGNLHNTMNNSNGLPPPPYSQSMTGSGGHTSNNIYNNNSNNNIKQQPLPNNNSSNQQRNSANETNLKIYQQQEAILNSYKEIKLYNGVQEREVYENLAELYAIIRATEVLEKAYIRDDVSAKDYTTSCSKLIAQFKSSQTLVKDNISNVPNFMKDYDLNCKAAYDRLVNKGFPATLEHTTHTTDLTDSARAKNVAEAVQTFITTMDSVRLKMVAVDNLHPYLSDLMECLNKNTWLPKTFDGKEKIMHWISTLNKMKANDELDEDQTRQLLFDLESSYNVFYKAINN